MQRKFGPLDDVAKCYPVFVYVSMKSRAYNNRKHRKIIRNSNASVVVPAFRPHLFQSDTIRDIMNRRSLIDGR